MTMNPNTSALDSAGERDWHDDSSGQLAGIEEAVAMMRAGLDRVPIDHRDAVLAELGIATRILSETANRYTPEPPELSELPRDAF